MTKLKSMLVKDIDPDAYREFKKACVAVDSNISEVIREYITAVHATGGSIITAVRRRTASEA